uniref:Tumor protein p53-inducible protein 11 n=1 Tax=Angiostrongylus cantonensis TaxID=6313 RepID=A0A0K0D6R6_ANGCA
MDGKSWFIIFCRITLNCDKISQLLGINENLYVRLPRGLLYWNTLTALYLYVFGIMGIITPTLALRLDYGLEVKSDESTFIARIYGSCLISFGILFRYATIAANWIAAHSLVIINTAVEINDCDN